MYNISWDKEDWKNKLFFGDNLVTPEIALKLWFDGRYFNLGSPGGLFVITSTSTSSIFGFLLKKIQFTGKDVNGKIQAVDVKVGFFGLKTGTFIAPIDIPYDGLNITTAPRTKDSYKSYQYINRSVK